jgi:hypothetical protein
MFTFTFDLRRPDGSVWLTYQIDAPSVHAAACVLPCLVGTGLTVVLN